MAFRKIPLKLEAKNKKHVVDLHKALLKLDFKISANEKNKKQVLTTTKNAIKKFQRDNNLKSDGKLNDKTISAINTSLNDKFVTESKYRTKKLQNLLKKLDFKIDKEEAIERKTGKTTRDAIKRFQKKHKLRVDGNLSEEVLNKLHDTEIKKRLKTKNQQGLIIGKLKKVGDIAKLKTKISREELDKKKLGVTSKKLILEFQKKYKLNPTGAIDKVTLDKLESIAASRGTYVKKIDKPINSELKIVKTPLRINKVSPVVNDAQKALSFLGYKISEKEFSTQTFGKTTRKAVIKFQEDNKLPLTGHLEKAEMKALKKVIVKANPKADDSSSKYRIKGSVRDELWSRKGNMVIKVFEKLIEGKSKKPLASKKTFPNGFFDITYAPPIDPITGQIKSKFHIVAELYEPLDNNPANDKFIEAQNHFRVGPIRWINFTEGDDKYRGESVFNKLKRIVVKAIGDNEIIDLHETEEEKQVSQLALHTGLHTDEIMHLILSFKVAEDVNKTNILTAEVFYAFISQNIPPSLPSDLLRGTSDWETINQLTEIASSGIIFTSDEVQKEILENALSQNLISRKVKMKLDEISQEFNKRRETFTLTKPTLIGNQNVEMLLDNSTISKDHYSIIANKFIANNGINTDFWEDLKKEESKIGAKEIADFTNIVELGNISKNHLPTIQFFKSKIGTNSSFKKASSFAKLSQTELSEMIKQNGNSVPDNMPGDDEKEKIGNFAAAIKSRAEILFPAVSFVAEIGRSNSKKLKKIKEVEKFIDENTEFNLKKQNLDKYLLENNINLEAKTKEELKLVQRTHKQTSDPLTGTALINADLHSSMQIYFKGKAYLTNIIEANGIDAKQANYVYESAKMQYLRVLDRFFKFRSETNNGTPSAIIPQTYTKEEIQNIIGDIPNLETLFGSMDFCACEHCKSLYSPAAYFTDILRFLSEHDSLIKKGSKTLNVKEILFDRRPDLGNIKLNCVNTNTPLPYVDLVCEVLENYIAPKNTDFNYQTTLTAQELRAVPQYVRNSAYDTIAKSSFPMDSGFNLFQTEARTYLSYLRVPRFELMETFQNSSKDTAKVPRDVAIAAEYFGISEHEKDLIIKSRPTAQSQNNIWGFTTTQTKIPVTDLQNPKNSFLNRSKLEYNELLDLLLVRFVNDPTSSNMSEIIRPPDNCDTNQQTINNLSVTKFDLMHRFLRLWRKTGWKMWELDLLIRNPKIGNNKIDDKTLVNLKHFKQLQTVLKLDFEVLLAFYGEINREVRKEAENPDLKIDPLYKKLFQNIAITNPIDDHFIAIDDNDNLKELNSNIVFGTNDAAPLNGYTPVPTVLSSIALSQTDFDILVDKTNGSFSVESLSVLLRYVYFAKGLKLSVKDLLLLLSITKNDDPFATIETTVDCIKNLKQIESSKVSLLELDYILNFSPDSPIGLREESLVQLIESLRKSLADSKDEFDKLNLTKADQDTILAFDADALIAKTDVDLLADISPLQDILNSVSISFDNAGFSIEETSFVIQFEAASISDANKTLLVESIKTLQVNLIGILNLGENQLKSQIASSFSLTDSQATILITKLKLPSQNKMLLEILKDETLIEKDFDGSYTNEISEFNFQSVFETYLLLHKVALLVSRLKFSDDDLQWFIESQNEVGSLDFSALPIDSSVSTNNFANWLNLFKFLDFKSNFPEPEDSSIRSILDLAKDKTNTKSQIFDEIVKLTQWSKDDLKEIDAKLKLQHTATKLNYTLAETYERLKNCFDQMKLTGVDAKTMFGWAVIDKSLIHDKTVAIQSRQAVKSKYEEADWLKKITPLNDQIRDEKREALVQYHIENSLRKQSKIVTFSGETIPNPLYWKDAVALYKYFLIDVEMTSCQLTSRIKQAISSAQLFVQRCFLNLENRYVKVTEDEKEDVSSANAWSQWKWMKVYRIWEANRKVFFYPENWIEPELRDDKSPFFKELEDELMQNEVTRENVEASFLNYLQKVDEVSHLEVCGLYHEMENFTDDETIYERNIVHVIGRTKGIPQVYYYRKYDMNYSSWSAWEKIEVDIQGEQITPVVYNRKLHLFWLQFMEKPMKMKKTPAAKESTSDEPTDAPEPRNIMEVQLGWTIKKSAGWTPKKISKQKLIHPWERPHHSYNLKPYYLAKSNELYMDIYLSTSIEFNNRKFYDPTKRPFLNPVYLTQNRFNETYRPWHSSSFVFDGDVIDVKLKGLGGAVYYPRADGKPMLQGWSDEDSYDYVHDNFGPEGEAIKELDPAHEYGPRLRLPAGMHFENTHLTNNQYFDKNSSNLRVLENNSSKRLLSRAISPFELVIPQQDLQLNTFNRPVFYQDNKRAFFIKPEWETVLNNYGQTTSRNRKYRTLPFYHPYTMLFLREFNRDGIDGLLNRKIQTRPETFTPQNPFNFNSYGQTSSVIVDDTAKQDITDFSYGGAYSIYNWELFFHVPLMIACRLMQNQKFEDAMLWFHYIFNPTNIENLPTPQRYWITKPFFEYNSEDYRTQRIENILSNIDLPEFEGQLREWKNSPFKPHLIARNRPVAYQKNVVMKYIDNLIAWGDMLFRRDSIESINEASNLYMLAYELLGERPQKVPNVKHDELTFNELEPKLDEFGNARVDIVIEDTLLPIKVVPSVTGSEPIPKLETLYFCIPNNDFLDKYWDTVEDRLFKIRNCLNIEGVFRQLALFQPPIDPALLVKAAAAGIDLSSVLNDLAAPTPHYRFRIVVQKAIEFCNEVKNLGDKLLSVLEKKDVEQLSLLRSLHEVQLLEAVKEVRKKQIDEVKETTKSLDESLKSADEKITYYEEREYMNVGEGISFGLSIASTIVDAAVAVGYIMSGGLKLIPSFLGGGAGFGGSPEVSVTMGGQQIGNGAEMAVRTLQSIASTLDKGANLASTIGSYDRRKDEWDFQGRLANFEKEQIQFQINASEIRQGIAEKELENHELQIENSKVVDDYLRNKFTNEQLYSWMITQISTVYFQAYQLAFDMAKKAEKCFQHELGLQTSNYIQFGYWDSLKKGLLSGDKLMNDLRRLESAYIDQNKREFELTKHISLAQMFPLQFMTLKQTGKCTITLPEWLYDMDYPGQYMRRIKNVSVSIPCIVGPYAGVNCTLSLLRNETRITTTVSEAGDDYAKIDESDDRFRTMFGAISSIATSHAQNDSGMFELNFNDERYLPFEGAGVISDWQVELPIENNQFDFNSLSDVILHISYTSRNGGGLLTNGAKSNLDLVLPNVSTALFSLRQEFSTEWYKFINPENDIDQEFVITLSPESFPFFVRGKLNNLKIKTLSLFIESEEVDDFVTQVKVTNTDYTGDNTISKDMNLNGVHYLPLDLSANPANSLGELRFKLKLNSVGDFKSLIDDKVKNAYLLLQLGD